MDNTAQAIIAKVHECMDTARRLYPTACLTTPSVSFKLRGAVAGSANAKVVTFNLEMACANAEFVSDTVPHEVAHAVHRQLIAQRLLHDPKPHGHTWKLICRQLGGNGQRCHHMTAPNTAKRRRFTYKVGDYTFQVGPCVHRKIQAGYIYQVKKGSNQKVMPTDYIGSSL